MTLHDNLVKRQHQLHELNGLLGTGASFMLSEASGTDQRQDRAGAWAALASAIRRGYQSLTNLRRRYGRPGRLIVTDAQPARNAPDMKHA